MSKYLSVRNWNRFQHYGDDRNIVWVKLYTSLLDDEDLQNLPLETQLLWDRLLLLAARKRNAIRSEPEAILKATGLEPRMNSEQCRESIALLVKGRWLRETTTKRRSSKPASKPASHSASTRREEKNLTPQTPLSPNGKVNDRGCTHKSCEGLEVCRYE